MANLPEIGVVLITMNGIFFVPNDPLDGANHYPVTTRDSHFGDKLQPRNNTRAVSNYGELEISRKCVQS